MCIQVKHAFQIAGVDIRDMSITTAGNKHGPRLLYQIPIVCPSPDQTTWVLVDEVIPLFGSPEALLSDRGTNLRIPT